MKVDLESDFGKRECPSCGIEVEANHNRCPICSYEFPNYGPARKGLKIWGSLILALLLLGLILAGAW